MTAVETPALVLGGQIGPFVIREMLGAGGMGEVYLARDTNLERDVALKVLPHSFKADGERMARFLREAKLLASLSHPNIAAIYGLEDADGVQALVLEFVDGPTLAHYLSRVPLPLDEAINVAVQMSLALEAAHEQGIIHRDLKPANVKLRPDGVVKVLDFGLAKALEQPIEDARTTQFLTAPDAVLRVVGTAAYMSPEQAKGQVVDQRSDIFSFGAILFEMLAGQRAFEGDTPSEAIASVLRGEPDWPRLAATPPAVLRILRRCLAKDRKARFAAMADVRHELEEVIRPGLLGDVLPVIRRTPVARRLAVAASLIAVTGIGAGVLAWRRADAPPGNPVHRLSMALGPGRARALGRSPSLAISPDGRRVAFIARVANRALLVVRRLDQFDASIVAGSDGASAPFFSPDSRTVGYFAGEALWRVDVDGGAPLKIADAAHVSSASWGTDDQVVVASSFAADGLWRVPAGSGELRVLTTPADDRGELRHHSPQVLPDARHVLFTVDHQNGTSSPALLTVATGVWQTLSQIRLTSGGARYLPTGHLVYAQGGGLVTVPFDRNSGAITASPSPVRERLEVNALQAPQFDVATGGEGTLVYLPDRLTSARGRLVIVDDAGQAGAVSETSAVFMHPRLSPDGQRVAVTIETEGGSDVWVYDLARGRRVRLTTDGMSRSGVWSSDSRTVTYHSAQRGPWTMFQRLADGSAKAIPLISAPAPERRAPTLSFVDGLLPGSVPALSGASPQFPGAWSPDGRTLAFVERRPGGDRDIWMLTPGGQPTPFLTTPADESSPVFSPDGRFVAYVSDEGGREDVYVQPYPGPGGRWLVSEGGGSDPVWSRDPRQLSYRAGDALVSVQVRVAPEFEVVSQRRMMERRFDTSDIERSFDLAGDTRRIVFAQLDLPDPESRFHVVVDWFRELRQR
jgi:eukaryotic-like serine/threonine-protein kinase